MSKLKWYYNSYDGEIASYQEYGDGETSFPRGTWLVYRDYIVTGFDTKAEAEEWKAEWHACKTCKAVRHGDICWFCGNVLVEVDNE